MKSYNKIKLKDGSDLVYFNDMFDFEVPLAKSDNVKLVAGLSHPGDKDISDHYDYIGLACWVEQEAQRLAKISSESNGKDTQYIFTFNLNKPQINRHLLLKFVEWFQLNNYVYTWSGISNHFDMSNIIQEWEYSLVDQIKNNNFKSFMLEPVTIDALFYDNKGEYTIVDNDVRYNSDNLDPWKFFIEKMHHQSAIALIAESVAYKKNINFTEKTVYAMLGYNFPIWIGGYAQASHWKSMGFDIFDDIIDHSYQYKETLFDRIYFAFKSNLDLLENFENIKKLREKHFERLRNNRQLIIENQINKHNRCMLDIQDEEVKQELVLVIEKFFKYKYY